MANNETMSVITTDETPTYNNITMENGTTATPEFSLGSSEYDNVSETSNNVTAFGTTTKGPDNYLHPAVPAVIVFSVLILILAIGIFGARSKTRKRRPTRREKREEDETLMTKTVCKESIYLDVMPSTAIEEDEQQVERETPYVTLEFESSNKGNEETPVESVLPMNTVAEVPGLLLESLETRL